MEIDCWEELIHSEDSSDETEGKFSLLKHLKVHSDIENKILEHLKSMHSERPSEDAFVTVTCIVCGMVLKQKALFEHLLRRHKVTVEVEVENSPESEPQIDFFPQAKRIKLDENLATTTDTLPLRDEQIFTLEYENAARLYRMHQNYYIQEFSGLKMKLKKGDRGNFGAVACS